MLILTVKISEAVFINNNVICRVLNVVDDRIKLGFVADKSIVIDREKVHYKKFEQLLANQFSNSNEK